VFVKYFVWEGLTEVVESIEASHRFMAVAEEGAGEGMSDWHSLGC
jgi:hypothetical protein